MEEAGKEERQLALEREDVDKDGIPFITVIADGAWSKSSYRTNYNAPSAWLVLSPPTLKSYHKMDVRNRYCSICAKTAIMDIIKY